MTESDTFWDDIETQLAKIRAELADTYAERDRLRGALKGLMTRVWFACPQMDAADKALANGGK